MSKLISEKSQIRKESKPVRKRVPKAINKWTVSVAGGKQKVTFSTSKVNNHFLTLEGSTGTELSYKDVEPLLDFLGYSQKEAATFLEVDPGTISRWKRSQNMIGQLRTKNLMDVDGIIAKGIRIFGSEGNFRDWLNTSNYALGDVSPSDLLKSPYGVEQVEEAVDALSWGNYL